MVITLLNVFFSLLKMRSALKGGRNAPFVKASFEKGLSVPESKQKIIKVVFLKNNAENLPIVPSSH